MAAHIKVNGTSWCQFYVSPTGTMFDIIDEARKQGVYPTCQHETKGEADKFAAILAAKGFDAQVVDGPCDQRDRED